MNTSLFITIEGGEGVGKSFFIKYLSESLKQQGFDHILTREPGGTKLAEKLRALLSDPITAEEELCMEAELLIISAARAQHVQHKILPSLSSGVSVLCDRFADSSFVYQGKLGGLTEDFIENITNKCTKGLQPDLTFLLDCPLELSQERMQGRTNDGTEVTKYDQKTCLFTKK